MNLPARGVLRALVHLRTRFWPRINVRLAPACQACGYSLAGLAGQGVSRCPECGQALLPHEFGGLFRIRGRTAWIVSACGPLLLASPFLVAIVGVDAASKLGGLQTRIETVYSAAMLVAAGSAAIVVAMVRQASLDRPFLIRATNWQFAMMSIVLLALLLGLLMVVLSAASQPPF